MAVRLRLALAPCPTPLCETRSASLEQVGRPGRLRSPQATIQRVAGSAAGIKIKIKIKIIIKTNIKIKIKEVEESFDGGVCLQTSFELAVALSGPRGACRIFRVESTPLDGTTRRVDGVCAEVRGNLNNDII